MLPDRPSSTRTIVPKAYALTLPSSVIEPASRIDVALFQRPLCVAYRSDPQRLAAPGIDPCRALHSDPEETNVVQISSPHGCRPVLPRNPKEIRELRTCIRRSTSERLRPGVVRQVVIAQRRAFRGCTTIEQVEQVEPVAARVLFTLAQVRARQHLTPQGTLRRALNDPFGCHLPFLQSIDSYKSVGAEAGIPPRCPPRMRFLAFLE